MAVTITITTAGSSISDPLAVYTSPNNITWTFDSNVAKATLLTGYTFTPPVGTYYYQVRDLGTCESILSLNCTTTTSTTTLPLTTTTTTTSGTPFFDTVSYGDNASDACYNPTFSFTMTGNGTTFCTSTVFTSLGWNIIATGDYVLSYGGNTLTVSHVYLQDYATVYGGSCESCPAPPSTTTTTTTTLTPIYEDYFATLYNCGGECALVTDTYVRLNVAGNPAVLDKYYNDGFSFAYQIHNLVTGFTPSEIVNVPYDDCAAACAGI